VSAELSELPRVERSNTGHPIFFHACEGRDKRTILPLNHETGWWWADGGHLMPSIHCTTCGTHGWWRGADGWVTA
jgi:hypothetical protein